MRKLLYAALAIAIAASPALALDRRMRVNNRSSLTVVKLQGSNVGADSWEEDILGDDVIPPHTRVTVNFNDNSGYCKFDLRAISEDGRVWIRYNVNVCTLTDWNLYD